LYYRSVFASNERVAGVLEILGNLTVTLFQVVFMALAFGPLVAYILYWEKRSRIDNQSRLRAGLPERKSNALRILFHIVAVVALLMIGSFFAVMIFGDPERQMEIIYRRVT
jgi:Na+/H+ antiporter NhaD/arsenite permease-like protein